MSQRDPYPLGYKVDGAGDLIPESEFAGSWEIRCKAFESALDDVNRQLAGAQLEIGGLKDEVDELERQLDRSRDA